MKRLSITTILCIIFSASVFAQVKRVAIVDFEISSTNTKYNGLGKAMSDMLITDMKNNVSSSKAVFIERNQINKVLSEQKFQKGANVDQKSTVAVGKILGVNYMLTGSIFVLDGMCSIDSKLIDVATGEIIYAESVDGNLSGWLQLKSKLGSKLSQKLALPVQKYKLEETATISENVLTNYSSAVEATDNNNFDEAQKLLKEIRTEDANFEYSSPLMKHIIELINATKKFDDKEEAILSEAQAFIDSLKMEYDKKFSDYRYYTSTELYKVGIEKEDYFLSKIDKSSRFSAEFPVKYRKMVRDFYDFMSNRDCAHTQAEAIFVIDSVLSVIQTRVVDSIPYINQLLINESKKQLDKSRNTLRTLKMPENITDGHIFSMNGHFLDFRNGRCTIGNELKKKIENYDSIITHINERHNNLEVNFREEAAEKDKLIELQVIDVIDSLIVVFNEKYYNVLVKDTQKGMIKGNHNNKINRKDEDNLMDEFRILYNEVVYEKCKKYISRFSFTPYYYLDERGRSKFDKKGMTFKYSETITDRINNLSTSIVCLNSFVYGTYFEGDSAKNLTEDYYKQIKRKER